MAICRHILVNSSIVILVVALSLLSSLSVSAVSVSIDYTIERPAVSWTRVNLTLNITNDESENISNVQAEAIFSNGHSDGSPSSLIILGPEQIFGETHAIKIAPGQSVNRSWHVFIEKSYGEYWVNVTYCTMVNGTYYPINSTLRGDIHIPPINLSKHEIQPNPSFMSGFVVPVIVPTLTFCLGVIVVYTYVRFTKSKR